MGRRKAGLDRDALREKLIALAEALVLQGGPQALTARALATHLGYSLGHIYNLVTDMDELVLAINAHTLDRLYDALQDAAEDAKPTQRLLALAQAYLEFCQKNTKLWALVMDHRLGEGQDLPEDYAARIAALPQLVQAELKALFPRRSGEALKKDVATLWSGLHGLSALDHAGRLALIGAPSAQVLARHLVENFLHGLKEPRHV